MKRRSTESKKKEGRHKRKKSNPNNQLKRKIEREHQENEAKKNIIDNRNFEWWMVVGALLFLHQTMISWSVEILKDFNQENKTLLVHHIYNFCTMCLVYAGYFGYGITITQLKTFFNNLCNLTIQERKNCLDSAALENFFNSSEYPKIFNISVQYPISKYALFGTILENFHPCKTWLNEPGCKRLQQGLRLLVVEKNKSSYSLLDAHFPQNYLQQGCGKFSDLVAFSLWWYDEVQTKVFRALRPQTRLFNEFIQFGKKVVQTIVPPFSPKPILEKRAPDPTKKRLKNKGRINQDVYGKHKKK